MHETGAPPSYSPLSEPRGAICRLHLACHTLHRHAFCRPLTTCTRQVSPPSSTPHAACPPRPALQPPPFPLFSSPTDTRPAQTPRSACSARIPTSQTAAPSLHSPSRCARSGFRARRRGRREGARWHSAVGGRGLHARGVCRGRRALWGSWGGGVSVRCRGQRKETA